MGDQEQPHQRKPIGIETAVHGMKTRAQKRRRQMWEETTDQGAKMDMMELFMPAMIAWNMFRMFQFSNMAEEAEKRQQELDAGQTQASILEKIDELMEQQKALTDLHVKAAEAAKQREVELTGKLQQLEEQAEKDRKLLQFLKRKI